MSISFSGLASGMDTSTWVEALVAAKESSMITPLETQYKALNSKKTALSTVKTTYSSLLSATQKFTDSKFGVGMDLFAKNIVSSSNEKAISATVTNSTPRQNLSIEVLQLATNTKVTSKTPITDGINENTQLSTIAAGTVKEGSMSVYVGGKRFEINVTLDDTLGNIAEKIEKAAVDENGNSLVDVSFEDGKFTITSTNGEQIRVGSNADTSTLANALSLTTLEDGRAQSSYTIGAINLSAPLTSVESGFYKLDENGEKVPLITEGTFKIGSAEFAINEKTTMNELISKINSSTNAQTNISYDSIQNKMILKSNQEGSFNINIEGGTSNITDILGLTENGNIIPETQELGQNAKISINGSIIQSFSNTITSEVSGIAGLTLDIKEVSEEGKPLTISIGQDIDAVVTEVENLVKAINSLISTTDTATESGAHLQYDSSLNGFRNDVRSIGSASINTDSIYKTLASIGITTGEFGTSIEAETNQFQIDKEKLKEALQKDPDAVKVLLSGDEANGVDGIAKKLQETMDQALDITSGFFKNREDTLSSQMNNINSQITTKTTFLENYQAQLEKKFQAMESQIAKLQNMQNQMSSILTS